MKKSMKKFLSGILTMALVIGMFAGAGTLTAEAATDSFLDVYVEDEQGNKVEGVQLLLRNKNDASDVIQFEDVTDSTGNAYLDIFDYIEEAGTYCLETAEGSEWVCSEPVEVVIAAFTSNPGVYIDTVGGEEYSEKAGYTFVVKSSEGGEDTPTPSEAKIDSVSVSPAVISRSGQEVTVTVKGENLPSTLYYKRSNGWAISSSYGESSGVTTIDSTAQAAEALEGTENERSFIVNLEVKDYDVNDITEYYLEIAASADGKFFKTTIPVEAKSEITEVSVPEGTTIGKNGGTVIVTVKGTKLPNELYYQRNYKWGDELADGTKTTIGPVTATGTEEEKTIEVELPAVSGTYANARQWTIKVGSTNLGYKPSEAIIIPIDGVAQSPEIKSVAAPEKVSVDGGEIEVTVNGTVLPDKAYYRTYYVYESNGNDIKSYIDYAATETALSGDSDTSKTFKMTIPKKEEIEKGNFTIKAWEIRVNLVGMYASASTYVSSNEIAIEEEIVTPPEKTEIEAVTYSITEAKRAGDEVTVTVTGTALPENLYYVISYKKANGAESYAGTEQQVTATGTSDERSFTVALPAVSEYPEAVAWRIGVNTESNDGYYFQKDGMNDKDISIAPDDAVTEETKVALDSAIAEAEKLNEADYTAESWKAYADAIAAANKLKDNADATETQYQEAIKAINDAKAALKEEVAEPSITKVSVAESVSQDATSIDVTVEGENLPNTMYYKRAYKYVNEYGDTLTQTLDWSGKEIAATGDEGKRTLSVPVNYATHSNALEWVINVSASQSGEYSSVNVKIEGAEPKTPEITGVTVSKTTVSVAGETITATVTGVNLPDTMYGKLWYSMEMNGISSDISYGDIISSTEGTDTEKTFEVVIPAKEVAGRDILGWKFGAAIQQYATYTKSGLITLEEETLPDEVKEETKAALDLAIAGAADLTEADYTAESWKAYKDAIDAANELKNNADATETQYQEAIRTINDAKAALKEAEKPTPQPTVKNVKVSKITLSGISKKIAAGKKIQLSASVAPKNVTNKAVTWTTSNKKYATVSSTGKVTVKKAGIGKTVTIKATAKDGSGVKATYKIKIMKNAVKSIKLKAAKTVKAGKSLKVKATVKANGKKVNKKLKWTSSNTKYATVNSKGKVTAKKAGKGKTVKITARATDGSGKKKTVKIKIK